MRDDKYELLASLGGIDDDDISEMNRDELNWYIEKEISKYEKRYKTKIVGLLIAGKVGLWSGDKFGGKFVSPKQGVSSSMGSCDVIELYKNKETNEYLLVGKHHDGTHQMKIYLVSESKAKRHDLNIRYSTMDAVEKGVKVLKPLKVS